MPSPYSIPATETCSGPKENSGLPPAKKNDQSNRAPAGIATRSERSARRFGQVPAARASASSSAG